MSFDDTYNLEALDLRPIDWSHVPVINNSSEEILDEVLLYEFKGNQKRFTMVMEPFGKVIESSEAFSIRIGEDIGGIIFSPSQIREFVAKFSEATDVMESLCLSSQALLIENTFSQFFYEIEDFFGHPIALGVEDIEYEKLIKVSINLDGKRCLDLYAHIPRNYIDKVKRHPFRINNSSQFGASLDQVIALSVSIKSSEIKLKAEEFFDLQVNDALTFSMASRDIGFEDVFVNGRKAWRAKVRSNRYVIDAATKSETSLQYDLKSKRSQEVNILNDSDVKIHVELCSKKLKISELKKLKPGSTLPFDTKLPDQVKLFVGETCFAIGDLMQLDGNIVIRITDFEV